MDIDLIIHKAKLDYMLAGYGFMRETPMRCEHGKLMDKPCKECEAGHFKDSTE